MREWWMLKGKDAALLAELSFLGSEGLQEAEGLCLEQGLTHWESVGDQGVRGEGERVTRRREPAR